MSKQELLWWVENLRLNNERSIRQKDPNLVIQTDASKSGWGVFCNEVSTGGKWSEKENLHINVLEVIAAKFAILTFTKGQSNIAIHLQIDSKTALSYLLKMEGVGYTQQKTLAHQQVHLELPSPQPNCNVCRVPSQCSKCTCRLGITKCQGQFRMETKCFSFPRDCNTHGTTNSGSVCIQILPPTSSIHCMETRPRQHSNRCIPSSSAQGVQFCFSSIQLGKSGSKEDDSRKNRPSNHSDTHMSNSALVCTTSKNVCTATIFLLPQIRNLLTNPQGKIILKYK